MESACCLGGFQTRPYNGGDSAGQRIVVTDHHRRSIRLRGFDYASPGAYFMTICTHDRADVLGEIVEVFEMAQKI